MWIIIQSKRPPYRLNVSSVKANGALSFITCNWESHVLHNTISVTSQVGLVILSGTIDWPCSQRGSQGRKNICISHTMMYPIRISSEPRPATDGVQEGIYYWDHLLSTRRNVVVFGEWRLLYIVLGYKQHGTFETLGLGDGRRKRCHGVPTVWQE